jgi:hypothetical protein
MRIGKCIAIKEDEATQTEQLLGRTLLSLSSKLYKSGILL